MNALLYVSKQTINQSIPLQSKIYFYFGKGTSLSFLHYYLNQSNLWIYDLHLMTVLTIIYILRLGKIYDLKI